MQYFTQGFLLGLAYVAPIGMQNMYVISAAITGTRRKARQLALVTAFFDISLAVACFFGVGALLSQFPLLRRLVLLAGGLAVLAIGIGLLRSRPAQSSAVATDQRLDQIVWRSFIVTWLNPQAVIDGSLLLGGFRASLPADASLLFMAGVATASLCWFLGLSLVVSHFREAISQQMIRLINLVSGVILVSFAIKLLLAA